MTCRFDRVLVASFIQIILVNTRDCYCFEKLTRFTFEMEKKSRLRAPNFTNSDNLLLCDIISKHKNIIENKKTDGANLLQKQKAWLEVGKEFNAITTGFTRTLESLQQNYKNLKKKAKKNASSAKMEIPVDKATLIENIEEYGTSSAGWEKVAKSTGTSEETCQDIFSVLCKEAETKEKIFKKNIMGTGGGPPPKFDDDPLLEKVKTLVGPSMEGLYTIYDGDSSLMAIQNLTPIEIKNMDAGEEPSQAVDVHNSMYVTTPVHKSEDNNQSYFANDRANLKRKPHDLLTRKRKLQLEVPEKQTVSEKFKNLASEKMNLVEMQSQLLKTQLIEENEKLEHNRLLRAMEIEDAREKYAHNKIIRKLELDRLSEINKSA